MQSTRLSEKTWKVSGIDEDRKRRLLTWEFPNIVQEICRTAIPKTAPDSNGIDSVLELHVDPILVDLFHNPLQLAQMGDQLGKILAQVPNGAAPLL